MTTEQLDVAVKNVGQLASTIGWTPHLEFKKGLIENLSEAGIEKQSVDVVISNCVVNLSPRKDLVLQSVFESLREGGEFYFSDVYCDRRLPKSVTSHKVLWGECIAGALYLGDFLDIAERVGFRDVRLVSKTPITIEKEFADIVGDAKFFSITYRLFKLSGMEKRQEDYGQEATYLGTISDYASSYQLDEDVILPARNAIRVSGNTAMILSRSWLKPYFKVEGDQSQHLGLFAPDKAESATCCPAPKSSCC